MRARYCAREVTDGAANEDFRKCSTSSFVVGNPGAESYAYDDTSPAHSLGAERSFLERCARGASGDGYEDRKHVYPMINSGPPRKAKLEKKLGHDALAICKTVPNGGSFGIYNASWREAWTPTDPRLVALENELDRCTRR